MKKIVVFFSIILLAISICILTIILINSNNIGTANIVLPNEFENIISVRMRKGTEGGYLYYKTNNTEIIKEIYNALINVKIGREADINVADDSRDYILDFADGTEKVISFQSVFYYENYKTYETENYKELRKIELPETECWE